MYMYMYVQLTAYPTLLIYYEEKYAGRKGRKEEGEMIKQYVDCILTNTFIIHVHLLCLYIQNVLLRVF